VLALSNALIAELPTGAVPATRSPPPAARHPPPVADHPALIWIEGV
jgi:hypothetical protein